MPKLNALRQEMEDLRRECSTLLERVSGELATRQQRAGILHNGSAPMYTGLFHVVIALGLPACRPSVEQFVKEAASFQEKMRIAAQSDDAVRAHIARAEPMLARITAVTSVCPRGTGCALPFPWCAMMIPDGHANAELSVARVPRATTGVQADRSAPVFASAPAGSVRCCIGSFSARDAAQYGCAPEEGTVPASRAAFLGGTCCGEPSRIRISERTRVSFAARLDEHCLSAHTPTSPSCLTSSRGGALFCSNTGL